MSMARKASDTAVFSGTAVSPLSCPHLGQRSKNLSRMRPCDTSSSVLIALENPSPNSPRILYEGRPPAPVPPGISAPPCGWGTSLPDVFPEVLGKDNPCYGRISALAKMAQGLGSTQGPCLAGHGSGSGSPSSLKSSPLRYQCPHAKHTISPAFLRCSCAPLDFQHDRIWKSPAALAAIAASIVSCDILLMALPPTHGGGRA